MAYITRANFKKIIYGSAITGIDIEREIYRIPIYFFSKYEKQELIAIMELLEDPENYFTNIYQPVKTKDTYSCVYEGQKPAYHNTPDCPRLNSSLENFTIPDEIKDNGSDAVLEFRNWFETVKDLLDKPDVFVARLHAKYGIISNPQAIKKGNSGSFEIENISIEELDKRIYDKIKEAGRFYYSSNKNSTILKRFSKLTFLAKRTDPIEKNDTGYSDNEVKALLKEYKEKFKDPLKEMLIQYYRIKLNPELKIDSELLDNIGFVPCGKCHSTVNF